MPVSLVDAHPEEFERIPAFPGACGMVDGTECRGRLLQRLRGVMRVLPVEHGQTKVRGGPRAGSDRTHLLGEVGRDQGMGRDRLGRAFVLG